LQLQLVTPIAASVLCHVHQSSWCILIPSSIVSDGSFSQLHFVSLFLLAFWAWPLHSVSGRHGFPFSIYVFFFLLSFFCS